MEVCVEGCTIIVYLYNDVGRATIIFLSGQDRTAIGHYSYLPMADLSAPKVQYSTI